MSRGQLKSSSESSPILGQLAKFKCVNVSEANLTGCRLPNCSQPAARVMSHANSTLNGVRTFSVKRQEIGRQV